MDHGIITPTMAHQVIWHYGRTTPEAGYEPGNFISRLLSAISAADDNNRMQLALGFPGYVKAANLMERQENGYEILRQIAITQ